MKDKKSRVKLFRSDKTGQEAMDEVEGQLNAFCSTNNTVAGHGIVCLYPKEFEDKSQRGVGEKWFGEVWYEVGETDVVPSVEPNSPKEIPTEKKWQQEGVAEDVELADGINGFGIKWSDGRKDSIVGVHECVEKANKSGEKYYFVTLADTPTNIFPKKGLEKPFAWAVHQLKERPIA